MLHAIELLLTTLGPHATVIQSDGCCIVTVTKQYNSILAEGRCFSLSG